MGKASRVKKSRPSSPDTRVAPKENRVESWISRPLPGLILCVLLALLVNINVLQNEFGWDDEKIINGLGASSSISEIFMPISKSGAPYYRPLVSLSYRIDYALWGKDPFGYHLSVLLFHLLNTALVFVLARRLLSFSSNSPVTRH